MSSAGHEVHKLHTRLLKCALDVEGARAYWQRCEPGTNADAEQAFEEYWFGAKSLPRIRVLLSNFRARFDAFPAAFRVLHGWNTMKPDTRALIYHWHLQLSDPLYRAFTGEYLVQRRERLRPDVTRDLVAGWVADQGPGRWTTSTRIQFASKLLSAAYRAGLVTSNRDPRPLAFPRVGDDALTYLFYLLRAVEFEGTILDNPYLRSVGLDGFVLAERARKLSALSYRRQGEVVEFEWAYPDLESWAEGVGHIATLGGAA